MHAVFEMVDPADPELATALTRAARTVLARSAAGVMTPEQLASGLAPTFATPLGPLAGGRRLCDIPRSDQLAELAFEFGLAGGEVTTADLRLGLVAGLLRRHLGRRRSAGRLCRPARAPRPGRPDPAGLSDGQHRCGAPGPRPDRRAALPGGRLQDQLAGQLRRNPAHPRGLSAGPARRRDDARALPVAGPALLRRGAPLPSVATARLRPGAAPRRSALPVRAGDGRSGHAAGRRGAGRRVRLASAGRRWWPTCPTPSTAGRHDRPPALAPTGLRRTGRSTWSRTAPPDCWRSSTPPECWMWPMCVRRRPWPGWVRKPTTGCGSPWRSRFARSETGRSASTCEPSTPSSSTRTKRAWMSPSSRGRRSSPGSRRSRPVPWWPPAPHQPGGRPLRWAYGLLYLERYWQQEEQVRRELQRRFAAPLPEVDSERLAAALGRLFPAIRPPTGPTGSGWPPPWPPADGSRCWPARRARGRPRRSPGCSPCSPTSPGDRRGWRWRLPPARPRRDWRRRCASAAAQLDPADQDRLGPVTASTLHRLLGWLPASQGRFRHNATNQLPHDVVIVDEMSMVSLTMTARLLEAVRPTARLVLVGDPDQLSSVEAGAVLADIVRAPGTRVDRPDRPVATSRGGRRSAHRRSTGSSS